jgi:hypothetical protein
MAYKTVFTSGTCAPEKVTELFSELYQQLVGNEHEMEAVRMHHSTCAYVVEGEAHICLTLVVDLETPTGLRRR